MAVCTNFITLAKANVVSIHLPTTNEQRATPFSKKHEQLDVGKFTNKVTKIREKEETND